MSWLTDLSVEGLWVDLSSAWMRKQEKSQNLQREFWREKSPQTSRFVWQIPIVTNSTGGSSGGGALMIKIFRPAVYSCRRRPRSGANTSGASPRSRQF